MCTGPYPILSDVMWRSLPLALDLSLHHQAASLPKLVVIGLKEQSRLNKGSFVCLCVCLFELSTLAENIQSLLKVCAIIKYTVQSRAHTAQSQAGRKVTEINSGYWKLKPGSSGSVPGSAPQMFVCQNVLLSFL